MSGNPIITTFFVGLCGISHFIRYKIKERRFQRRNFAGLEVFDNYHISILTTIAEKSLMAIAGITMLLSWVSLIMILIFHHSK